MNQDTVMVPVGEWAKTRLSKSSETDQIRDEFRVGSGFGKNVSNWLGSRKVYPTNVIHMATECSNRRHSATFPLELPIWFIKLFTDEEDVVCDPFVGSGTTILAAKKMNRRYLGIDIKEEFCEMARHSLEQSQLQLQY